MNGPLIVNSQQNRIELVTRPVLLQLMFQWPTADGAVALASSDLNSHGEDRLDNPVTPADPGESNCPMECSCQDPKVLNCANLKFFNDFELPHEFIEKHASAIEVL